MPDDRFLHRRASHSAKVNTLTDLEYRVWTQYLLSADDFGVMRYSAIAIQSDNDALEARPAKAITAALQALVAVNLIGQFTHQQRPYLYQHDWQDWQKVTYPRKTIEPQPPVALCSRNTQWLLSHWPGGKPVSSWKAPEHFASKVVTDLPEDLENVSKTFSKSSSEPLAVSHVPEPLAVSRSSAAPPRPTPEDLQGRWNAVRDPGPKVDALNADRRRRLTKALDAAPNLDEWELVVRWINAQPWANAPGAGDYPNWRATLDWLCKPGKLHEYLDRAKADALAGPRLISSAGQSTKAAAEIVKAALRRQG